MFLNTSTIAGNNIYTKPMKGYKLLGTVATTRLHLHTVLYIQT